ncbi:MAG: hypothetical protein HY667_06715 [Chloroflexi bacterium]|nr:hypothetical protein [Chloroflexota bacterium]
MKKLFKWAGIRGTTGVWMTGQVAGILRLPLYMAYSLGCSGGNTARQNVKFLRSVFSDSFIGLILTMLGVFGFVFSFFAWRAGRFFPEGVAYGVAGMVIFILGRKFARRNREPK